MIRNLLTFVIVGVLSFAVTFVALDPATTRTVGESVRLAAVQVDQSSGVLVETKAGVMVVTAAHVAWDQEPAIHFAHYTRLDGQDAPVVMVSNRPYESIRFRTLDDQTQEFVAKLVCYSPREAGPDGVDLALYQTDAWPQDMVPAKLAPYGWSPKVGTTAWYAGKTNGLPMLLERSIICDFNFPGQYDLDGNGRRYVAVGGFGYYGNSGGGIYVQPCPLMGPRLVGIVQRMSSFNVTDTDLRPPLYGVNHRTIHDLVDAYLKLRKVEAFHEETPDGDDLLPDLDRLFGQ